MGVAGVPGEANFGVGWLGVLGKNHKTLKIHRFGTTGSSKGFYLYRC